MWLTERGGRVAPADINARFVTTAIHSGCRNPYST